MKRLVAPLLRHRLRLVAGAGLTWSVVCIGLFIWAVNSAASPTRCPTTLEFRSFCESAAVDQLVGTLVRLGLFYGVGMLVTAAIAFFLWSRPEAEAAA